ncbi:MAG: hypothetical protein CMO97_05475 [Woeseia sp.]|nr:hypothetical protein [Woeseia sp.]
MLKKLVDLLFVGLVIFALLGLGGCASGGGSAGLVTEPTTPPPSTTSTQPYQTIDPFTYTYDTVHGDISVTYSSGSYLDDSNFPKTDKYKIADYGFFQITTQGRHDGTSRNPQETQDAGPFLNAGVVHRADLNGDGHQDFYYEGFFEGDREDMPRSYLHAFLNDGNGHFVYSPELFAGGTSPCINYGDLDYKTDPNHECGFSRHFSRSLVADFNGDGIDDFLRPSILHLSNNGVIQNKSQSNLPSWMFAIDDNSETPNGAYTHDMYAGDIDNDGDLDVFGAWSHSDESLGPTNHNMGILINDGFGNFTTNWNFYKMPSPSEVGAEHILWNTTAAVGDFDNDGYVDVSVGWANPGQAKHYGFADTYENSSGAVFWNDGNMDWSKYWSELPTNYWGENGVANDMEVMDINNDGLLDIVLASTPADPYYDGRVIQLFLNNGNRTFSDVSEQYGSITKYTEGSGSGWWNGEGTLHILDFDNDGDLDIVDSVNGTYVLLNNGGSFELYDNFPNQGDCGGCRYFPIEIDGKWQYDFIGYTDERTYDSQTSTFFQVLDPPLMEMLNDVTTKPLGYADSIFKSTMLLNDLRHQSKGNNVFGKVVDHTNMLGYSYSNKNGFGLFISDFSGNNEGGVLGIDYEGKNIHAGLSYSTNNFVGFNKTKWYGTGSADLETDTVNFFWEYNYSLTDTWITKIGFGFSDVTVKEFTEQDSSFNVSVNEFDMLVGNIFADLSKIYVSNYGTTYITLGAEYYETREVDIIFSSRLNFTHKEDLYVGKFGLYHELNMFYFSAELDTEGREIYQLGFRLGF